MQIDRFNRILQATRARLANGYAPGRYATRADGSACGFHCIHARKFDLAGALYLECELESESEREALFADAWNAVRTALERPLQEGSPEFCRWLDNHSQAWHLATLDSMLGISTPRARSVTPTISNILEEYA